jgi:hypothetical protein
LQLDGAMGVSLGHPVWPAWQPMAPS